MTQSIFMTSFFLAFRSSWQCLWARKAAWIGILVFSVCVLLIFPFAFGTEEIKRHVIRTGTFWAVNEFVVALTLGRLFVHELENGMLDYFHAARISKPGYIFGKVFFGLTELITLQIPLLFFWIVFYNVPNPLAQISELMRILFLFDLATASVGVMIAAVVARTVAKEILQPILFYPLQFTVLLASVTLSLANDPDQVMTTLSYDAWWAVLILNPVVFLAVGGLLSNHLLQD